MSTPLENKFNPVKNMGSAVETDPITGFYASEPLLEQLYEHCKQSPEKSYLVSADFTNLSQLNDVIGRQNANDVVQAICSIYNGALSKLDPAAQAGFRVHGDEVAWIVQGGNIAEKDLITCLNGAEKEAQKFIRAAGLSTLQHPRYENVTGINLTTTFAGIDKFSGSLAQTQNTLDFQLSTARDMMPKMNRNTLPQREFLHEHYLHEVAAALERRRQQSQPAQNTLPPGFEPKLVVGEFTRSRREEMETVKAAAGHEQSTLIRFSLYNLGGLNSLLGHDHVDEFIVRPMRDEIIAALRASAIPAENYAVYRREGGEFDVIIKGDYGALAEAVQAQVQKNLKQELFQPSIDEFIAARGIVRENFDIPGDVTMANLPHKRGAMAGAGIISTPVELGACSSVTEIFQKLESHHRLQEYHGVSFFETDRNSLAMQAHLIRAPVTGIDHFTIFIDPGLLLGTDGNRAAWALNNNLSHEQLGAIFKKPVGLMYEAMTGISLQPVLDRQKMIFHLMDKGVSPELIKQHLVPRDEFDRFVAEEMKEKDLRPVEMAGRPFSRPHGQPDFLTFNLARSWGYIPPALDGIDEVLLKSQAAVRALTELGDYKNGYRNNDSSQVIGEIRSRAATILKDADSKTDTLKTAQLVDHVMKIAKHEHTEPDPELIIAGHSLVLDTLENVAASFKDMGLGGVANEVKKLSAPLNLGPRRIQTQDAINILAEAATIGEPDQQAAPSGPRLEANLS